MKKLVRILTLMLLICTFVFMSACSSYNKVEKALENIGYTIVESNATSDKIEEESEVAVTTYVFSNNKGLLSSYVLVFEFKKTDDMKEFYEESKTLQGFVEDVKEDGSAQEFYDALVEEGYAKGNCLVFSISLDLGEINNVKDAIKNA